VSGMKRWLKRFWLRYLYYCKEHWFIAASIVLTFLWWLLSWIVPLLEILFAFL
jgi:hypothetical protein